MAKVAFMNNMSRTLSKFGFKIRKHSPEILMVAGVAGTVVSTVTACKATLKVDEILSEAKEKIEIIHEGIETGEVNGHEYPAEVGKKDLTLMYVQTGIKVAKLYGPSILLGAASIGCILSSHKIISKRNVALAAAYATVDQGFKEYRGRVIDRFGEAIDRELKHNITLKEIEETVTNEDGTEQTVKKTVEVADPNMHSDYARFFDAGCRGWEKDAEYNLMYVRQQQNWANEKLKAQGYLFLNDVYDMFGIPRTKAGQIVGWIYDEENPIGDNFVDFGIYDLYNEKARDFVNGHERTILLDFNVDGNIIDLMK